MWKRGQRLHLRRNLCDRNTCPVEGALGVVGGAMVQRAVEGPLIEDGRHVAVWRQRRPQLRVDLTHVAGVWAVEPWRDKQAWQNI